MKTSSVALGCPPIKGMLGVTGDTSATRKDTYAYSLQNPGPKTEELQHSTTKAEAKQSRPTFGRLWSKEKGEGVR